MEVLFYHLEQARLEQVLPMLLEKSLERSWRACVKTSEIERLETIDQLLWTYSREGFLPHGRAQDGHVDMQPVYLTMEDENPNGAQVLFLIDGAELDDNAKYERVVLLFDGRNDDMLNHARGQWKRLSEAGHDVTYWQQNEQGRWVKKA